MKKKAVYNIACPQGAVHSGNLSVSRWQAFPLPLQAYLVGLGIRTKFQCFQDTMQYEPVVTKEGEVPNIAWWVNFADPRLFTAFATRLFAQDEMQVAEHPSLAHLAIYLKKNMVRKQADDEDIEYQKVLPYTRAGNTPTPILISGAERRCRVNTDVNEEEGRPLGLYGNNFGRAEIPVIERATEVIDPPTITNIICMAALAYGKGEYNRPQIEDLLITAYTSFRAARILSLKMVNNGELGPIRPNVIIHTGNWGTGAFGGSKPLMAIIQMAAALAADIDQLVYHSFNEEGTTAYNEGYDIFQEELKIPDVTLDLIIEHLIQMKFVWGMSDGN